MAKDDKNKKAEEKPVEEAVPEDQAKKKKKRLIIFGAVGFLAVAGIGAGLALFLGKGDDKPKTVTASESASEDGGEHGEAKEGEHGEAKGGEHSEAKGAEHGGGDKKAEGEKKEGGHGDKKADGGEKKEGGHGDKKAEGGEKKEGGHGGKKDEKAEGGHGDKKGKGEDKKGGEGGDDTPSEYGEVFLLKPFNLNLGNALENRFIRIEVGFQYNGTGEQKRELEAKTPRMRDVVGTIVGRKTREFLLSRDGKAQLRKEIFLGVNEFLKMPVQDVFITDMMIE